MIGAGFDDNIIACTKRKAASRGAKREVILSQSLPEYVFAKLQIKIMFKEWLDVLKRRRKCHMKGNKTRHE